MKGRTCAAALAVIMSLPSAALAQGAMSHGLGGGPTWVKCPKNDPTMYVGLDNLYHLVGTGNGRYGQYMCRSEAEKKGIKPGPDVIAADKRAADKAAAGASAPAGAAGAAAVASPGPRGTTVPVPAPSASHPPR